MKDFVKLENVRKIYQMGEVEIRAVDGIDFEIGKGEFVVIVGPSGAGKTTVLNILGGMDTATSGKVLVDGNDVAQYTNRQLIGYRREDIGFVFQFYNLVPNLTALENVELALQICKEPLDAKTVLEEVGLGERLNNFPAQLSGGEQQRVSIARALAKNPKLLLCDEPTGSCGEICAFLGMVYPFIGNYVMIEPEMEQAVFDCDVWLCGHITVFALLKAGWVVLFNPEIKYLKEVMKPSGKEDK